MYLVTATLSPCFIWLIVFQSSKQIILWSISNVQTSASCPTRLLIGTLFPFVSQTSVSPVTHSLRSLSWGILLPSFLFSTSRLNWLSAIIGICNSLARPFKSLEIRLISCSRFASVSYTHLPAHET